MSRNQSENSRKCPFENSLRENGIRDGADPFLYMMKKLDQMSLDQTSRNQKI